MQTSTTVQIVRPGGPVELREAAMPDIEPVGILLKTLLITLDWFPKPQTKRELLACADEHQVQLFVLEEEIPVFDFIADYSILPHYRYRCFLRFTR